MQRAMLRAVSLVVGLHAVSAEQMTANPIRRVVTLLQDMQSKVTEEGKKEADLYEKFMCYCKTGDGDLSASIAEASAKIDSLTASLKSDNERKTQTKSDLEEHTASRDEAKDTMAKATALRKKEAAVYAKVKSDADMNVAALGKAITAIEKGVAGFLQSSAASRVRAYAMDSANLPDETREELLSFLSGTSSNGYVPQSGEIVGILKQMNDEMTQGRAETVADEDAAIKNYQGLMAAKKKEVATLQKQIEEEMTRIGNLEVALAGMANDLEDTQGALSADQKFKIELAKSCDSKTADWEEVQKTRATELTALADTIKVLNDDDALELFKKTLPSASMSLIQMEASNAGVRFRARSIVDGVRSGFARTVLGHQPALDFISMALHGKKAGFEKVITMVDDMVANLKTEQAGDEDKKQYCDAQIDQTEDKKKVLANSISDSETAIDEMEGSIAQLSSEIVALKKGIKALDKSVADATDLRKKENDEYKELMSSDTTAKEVLAWAKNRLNKFYNPALYKPPPAREMTEEERISVNMGGTLAPVAASGIAGTGIGSSFVQISRHTQSRDAPAPPPETFGAYSKKTAEGNGVVAMIDLLVADLNKQMQTAKVEETNAQSEYEEMMADSSAKRTADSKSLTQKTSEKVSTEESLQAEKDTKAATTKELMGTDKYMSSLHGECDWLLKYFDARKSARDGEIESLMNAKAVLSGADYSLLQKTAGFMARRA